MSAVIESKKDINAGYLIDEFRLLMDRVIADNSIKNDVENDIVNSGLKFVPEMISYIQTAKGLTRGLCAMCLIRIGEACVAFLEDAALSNREFAWAADYIINEIRG